MTSGRGALVLPAVVAVLAGAQAVLGLVLADAYRDTYTIRTGWPGNDAVTLPVASALTTGLARRRGAAGHRRRSAARRVIVWAREDPVNVAGHCLVAATSAAFSPRTPVRIVGGCLTVVGVGLAAVWLDFWAGYVFAGTAVPISLKRSGPSRRWT